MRGRVDCPVRQHAPDPGVSVDARGAEVGARGGEGEGQHPGVVLQGHLMDTAGHSEVEVGENSTISDDTVGRRGRDWDRKGRLMRRRQRGGEREGGG